MPCVYACVCVCVCVCVCALVYACVCACLSMCKWIVIQKGVLFRYSAINAVTNRALQHSTSQAARGSH
jgi:hypothetical protein